LQDVIANSAFGVDSNNFVDRNSKFAIMAHLFSNQFDGIGGIKLLLAIWFPFVFRTLRLHLLNINAVRFFGQVTKEVIEYRNRTGTRRNDFLQLLLDARAGQLREDDDDENEQETFDDKISKLRNFKASAVEFSDELILAQSLMFFLAGFDTAGEYVVKNSSKLSSNTRLYLRFCFLVLPVSLLNRNVDAICTVRACHKSRNSRAIGC
jgi:cytochrome P450